MFKFIITLSTLIVLLSNVTSFAATYTVSVNSAASWGALPHFWSRCFGIGRAGLIMDPNCQAHIRDGVKNLGLEGVRFHALFLEDVGIYKEVNGTPEYNWTKTDSIFDFLNNLKIKPVVELAFMPRDLAQNPNQTLMNFRAIASVPKDWNKWKDLIYETVKHFLGRYGAETISQWRFEVWNEPDLNSPGQFWMNASQQDYFKLYDYAVAGAVAAYPDVKIGGPVTSGHYKRQYISDFLNHVTTQNFADGGKSTKVDCIIYHTWHEYEQTTEAHFWVLNELKKYPSLNAIETMNTEFGPTWQFNLEPQPQETENGAAFLARVAGEISRRCHTDNVPFPFAYSWWVLSDVFDEGNYKMDRPFPSCMGLISIQGIYKPAYNVYKMLNMMGTTQISIERAPDSGPVHGFAAKDSNGGIQALLYNQVNNYPNCTAPVSGSDDVNLTINNIGAKPMMYRCYVVDQTHSNAYQAWKSMTSPGVANLSQAQWNSLRSSMMLAVTDSNTNPGVSGPTFTKSYSLAKEGVMLVTLSPDQKSDVNDKLAGKPDVPGLRNLTVRAKNTNLAFSVPPFSPQQKGTMDITIQIINSRGQIVGAPMARHISVPQTDNALTVDLRDHPGMALPGGVYLCKVKIGGYSGVASFFVSR
jgi:xylan 1,4-beta-xylosidase